MSEYIIQDITLKNIANAVREKKGTTDLIPVTSLAEEIKNLPSGGGGGKLVSLIDGSLTEIKASDLDGATSLRDYAFYYNTTITSVELPDTITSIGQNVFVYCVNLGSLKLPNNITALGYFMCQDCKLLRHITVPSLVTYMDIYTFNRCTSLATVTMLPTTPPNLPISTFNNCSALKKIIVPKGTLSVYKSATNWSKYADIIEEATE